MYAFIINENSGGFASRSEVREHIDKWLAGDGNKVEDTLDGVNPEDWGSSEEAQKENQKAMMLLGGS